jgi:hypothetical protein
MIQSYEVALQTKAAELAGIARYYLLYPAHLYSPITVAEVAHLAERYQCMSAELYVKARKQLGIV